MSRRGALLFPAPVSTGSLVILLALFIPASTAQAQARRNPDTPSARTYQLRGSVRSALNDMALEMVRVDLKMFTGETVSAAITRSNGEFEFSGLRSGVFLFIRPLDALPTSKDPAVSARDLVIPGRARSAFDKGMDQLLLKHAPEASLRHFDKALEQFPTYYEARHMRGIAYFQLGRLAEAEQEFRAALEMSEHKYPEPYFGLGALRMGERKFQEAVDTIYLGLAIDPESWRGHLELARALLEMNQVPAAAASIEKARQLRPDFPDVHLISANINMRRQDGPALLRDLDEYLKLKPDGPQADQAKKMRESLRMRLAAAETTPGTPAPKKPL